MRTALTASAAGLAAATYPVVWALGYQDHPWHWHTAADIVAFLAVIASSSLHALRRTTSPPVSARVTGPAVAVAYAALVSAMFWDWAGRPSDADVIGGPGFLLMPLAGAAAAVTVSALVVAGVRRMVVDSSRNA